MTNLTDNKFIEEMQERLEAIPGDSAMDAGVLDGFLTGCLLNPEKPSFEGILPYVFDEEGDPASVPDDTRLTDLIKARYDQILAALQAGNGLDPVIFPVVDENDNPIEEGDDIHESIEPWSTGFLGAFSLWPDDVMLSEDDENYLYAISAHVDPEYFKEEFPEELYPLYEEARARYTRLDEALYAVVEAVFMLKKSLQPNVPVRNTEKVGRNDPCPCGSGKKYKQCCGKN